MFHPRLFASPMIPIMNPDILGIASFILKFIYLHNMSLDDFELSWLSANFGEK